MVVAAAGNNGNAVPFYPASLLGRHRGGGHQLSNTRASFSNYGSQISVSAPGNAILSTKPNSTYDYMSGTSMASPYAAAEAALLKQAHADWTVAQIKSQMESTATDLGVAGRDDYYGNGLINPSKALLVPTVESLSPASGDIAGGTSVTITGTGFTGASAVNFGGVAATSFTVNSATSITAVAPTASAGAVSVSVVNTAGTGTKSRGFTYTAPAPPASGGGGGGGGSSGSSSSESGGGGGSGASAEVLEVRPAFGPVSGGTRILILGYGFWGAKSVTIGGAPVSEFRYIDAATVEVVTPPGVVGWQQVVVTLAVGRATATFRYEPVVAAPAAPMPAPEVYIATPTSPTTTSAPVAQAVVRPTNVRSVAAHGALAVAWKHAARPAAHREYVTVYAGKKFVKRIVAPVNASRVVIRGLKAGVAYTVRVTMVSGSQRMTSVATRSVRLVA